MKSKTYAAIDIGSNAARLLIKEANELNNGEVIFDKLFFVRYPLRLGDDVFTSGYISAEKEERFLRMIKAFRQFIKLYDVDYYRACGTSALRDSKNGKEVIKRIEKKTDIKIDIIEGKEEANLVYGSHIEIATNEQRTCAFVDVGGGSTEVTLIREGHVIYTVSFNIGTVRMLNYSEQEKADIINDMKASLIEATESWGRVDLIGMGGNINRYYKMSCMKGAKKGHIEVATLKKIYDTLEPLSMEERMREYGMKRDRADVIIPAGQIFLAIAEALRSRRIFVPTLGLVDGIIDNLYEKKGKKLKNKCVLPSEDDEEDDSSDNEEVFETEEVGAEGVEAPAEVSDSSAAEAATEVSETAQSSTSADAEPAQAESKKKDKKGKK